MGESLPDDKMPASPISKSYASPVGDLRQWIELFLVTDRLRGRPFGKGGYGSNPLSQFDVQDKIADGPSAWVVDSIMTIRRRRKPLGLDQAPRVRWQYRIGYANMEAAANRFLRAGRFGNEALFSR